MQQIHHLILDNFWVLVVVGFLYLGFSVAKKKRKWENHRPRFPSLETVNVLFKEEQVYGRSLKSFWTRFRNSSACLEVIATTDEIWIRPVLFVALLGDEFDLEHQIPIERVISVKASSSTISSFVELEFSLISGEHRRLHLHFKVDELFLTAVSRMMANVKGETSRIKCQQDKEQDKVPD